MGSGGTGMYRCMYMASSMFARNCSCAYCHVVLLDRGKFGQWIVFSEIEDFLGISWKPPTHPISPPSLLLPTQA